MKKYTRKISKSKRSKSSKSKISKSKRTRRRKFPKARAPTNLSDKRFYFLLDKRKKKITMNKRENYQLDFALNRKYCNCIEILKFKNYKSKKNINPYGICNSSIYKKRGLKSPKNVRKKCNIYI